MANDTQAFDVEMSKDEVADVIKDIQLGHLSSNPKETEKYKP
jgi:hypothetical protein